jgi:transcriptional pleiotropic regulator of transition state genes
MLGDGLRGNGRGFEDDIILKKYEPACIFCGNAKDVIQYKGKNICPACMEEFKK